MSVSNTLVLLALVALCCGAAACQSGIPGPSGDDYAAPQRMLRFSGVWIGAVGDSYRIYQPGEMVIHKDMLFVATDANAIKDPVQSLRAELVQTRRLCKHPAAVQRMLDFYEPPSVLLEYELRWSVLAHARLGPEAASKSSAADIGPIDKMLFNGESSGYDWIGRRIVPGEIWFVDGYLLMAVGQSPRDSPHVAMVKELMYLRSVCADSLRVVNGVDVAAMHDMWAVPADEYPSWIVVGFPES